jgi:hypothetical protein
MPWVEVFAAFVTSHLVGDYLLQTEWQVGHKFGGLSSHRQARRALVSHVATYTLAFMPALIWLLDDLDIGVLLVAAGIALPHLVQDDGRLLGAYVRRVKGASPENATLMMAVDQSFHILTLFGLSLGVGAVT